MKIIDKKGFDEHCKVAVLIMATMEINPHTKHHIRGAVREASNKLTTVKGSGKDKAEFMSENVQRQLEAGEPNGLVLEHGVPVSVMNSFVLELSEKTDLKNKTHEERANIIEKWHKEIAGIIEEWTVLSVITKKEHDTLRKEGLNQKMPDKWDGINKLARYHHKKVKIELVKNRHKELTKQIRKNKTDNK